MRIVVLAGGNDQIFFIEELKRSGHEIILLDYNDNPPARVYADIYCQESTLNADAVRNVAQSYNADLVVTACTDQALQTMARVSEELKLPCYLSYQLALNITNKAFMKTVMENCDIPTASFSVVEKDNSVNLSQLDFPLVVKPVDCNSSKGVIRVLESNKMSTALTCAIDHSRSHRAIVEEYIEGEEISVDCWVEDKNVKVLLITQTKKATSSSFFTITSSVYSNNNAIDELIIRGIAKKIVNGFGLCDTPLLIQMIRRDNKYYVLEFSARMGGGSKHAVIKIASGVDIMNVYASRVLGGKPRVYPQKFDSCFVMNYVYCRSGVIGGFDGFEQMQDRGVINDFFYYKTINSPIAQSLNSGDRVAGYLIVAPTEDALGSKNRIVNEQLRVFDVDGADMIRHDWLEM